MKPNEIGTRFLTRSGGTFSGIILLVGLSGYWSARSEEPPKSQVVSGATPAVSQGGAGQIGNNFNNSNNNHISLGLTPEQARADADQKRQLNKNLTEILDQIRSLKEEGEKIRKEQQERLAAALKRQQDVLNGQSLHEREEPRFLPPASKIQVTGKTVPGRPGWVYSSASRAEDAVYAGDLPLDYPVKDLRGMVFPNP